MPALPMFDAPVATHRVAFDESFRVADAPCEPDRRDKRGYKEKLAVEVDRIAEAQRVLFAEDRRAVLLVFQAMDAAGKDSTIRAILSGVNPAGCQVFSFKRPTSRELDQDFLWRTASRRPERGRIGVFNRSQYEEVLVVRVHPEILDYQRLPGPIDRTAIWAERLESIRNEELHLARNGLVIIKFWLNVSRDEQRNRFLRRLRIPEKRWKFSAGDVEEARHWDEYMAAYEAALNATSRPWAPWYAIPANSKPYMRYIVAKTVADSLESLDLRFPEPSAEDLAELEKHEKMLSKSP